MKINILIGGDAGQGLNELSNIISKILVKAGFYVFNYRDYRSLITGGHNFNVLCISDSPVLSHEWEYDVALLLDEDSLKHEKNFKKECIILHNQKAYKKGIFLDTSKYKKVENMYFAGTLFKILGLNKELLIEEAKKAFAGKSLLKTDLEAIEFAYKQNYKKSLKLKTLKSKSNKIYLTGADAVGIGSIEAGLDVYLAYPMTPSTSLLTFLAQQKSKHGYFVFSPESEIAVANAALGASYAGARTMIGTSGGGFDLMCEAISMQGQTELPLVAYLASRSGPSSGTPTYTGQEDLNVALYGGHGDFPRIIMTPGDIQEAYNSAKQAHYLAEKYKSLAIIFTDKHHAESGYSQEIKHNNLSIEKKGKYPGIKEGKVIKANSYSHDEQGNYTENPDIVEKQTKKRNEKLQDIKKEINKFETFKVYGNKKAKKLIIGFGSTKGAILDAIDSGKLKNYKYVHVIFVNPFTDKLIKEIESHNQKEIFVIENNSVGQFADLIQRNTSKIIEQKNRILKYNTMPFTPNEIIKILNKK